MSEYVDQEKSCRECGGAFVYTARDQRFFADMNYNPPVRCRPCRDKRKAANGGGHQAPETGRDFGSRTASVQAQAPEPYRRAPRYEPQPEPAPQPRKPKGSRRRRYEEDEDSDW